LTDFTLVTYLGGSAIALFVGLLTGIFGVGGGFLLTPALMVLLSVPGPIAVGTGLAFILVNSTYAIFRRRHSKTIDVKLGLTTAAGGIAGVFIGLLLMKALKTMPPLKILGREQVAVQYILLCLFLLLLAFITIIMVLDLYKSGGNRPDKRIGLFSRIKLAPYAHFDSLDYPKLSILPILVLGYIIGILTALLGVGGGVVMLPALVYLVGQHTAKAAGTSLLLVWVSSAAGITGHLVMGNIKPLLLLGMLICGIIGTNMGTHIGLRLPGSKIRSYFVYVVILAIAMVAFKLYVITFG
jgi:uncharacterized membrane protein YfcA